MAPTNSTRPQSPGTVISQKLNYGEAKALPKKVRLQDLFGMCWGIDTVRLGFDGTVWLRAGDREMGLARFSIEAADLLPLIP